MTTGTSPEWLVDNWSAVLRFKPRTLTSRCAVPDCQRTRARHGLCSAHFEQARRLFDEPYRDRLLAAKRTRWAVAKASRFASRELTPSRGTSGGTQPRGPQEKGSDA
jgi:hypothetical protein